MPGGIERATRVCCVAILLPVDALVEYHMTCNIHTQLVHIFSHVRGACLKPRLAKHICLAFRLLPGQLLHTFTDSRQGGADMEAPQFPVGAHHVRTKGLKQLCFVVGPWSAWSTFLLHRTRQATFVTYSSFPGVSQMFFSAWQCSLPHPGLQHSILGRLA